MPHFKCDACGHEYSDIHTFTSCPVCMELGKIDIRCTCVCLHERFSMRKLNHVVKRNPQCPVHGIAIADTLE